MEKIAEKRNILKNQQTTSAPGGKLILGSKKNQAVQQYLENLTPTQIMRAL